MEIHTAVTCFTWFSFILPAPNLFLCFADEICTLLWFMYMSFWGKEWLGKKTALVSRLKSSDLPTEDGEKNSFFKVFIQRTPSYWNISWCTYSVFQKFLNCRPVVSHIHNSECNWPQQLFMVIWGSSTFWITSLHAILSSITQF